MEWRNSLRRTQSQKSVSSSSELNKGTEVGLRDKRTSVSQLVSRYQTSSAVSPPAKITSNHAEQKQETQQITLTAHPPVSETVDRKLESLLRKNDVSERTQRQTNLFRSKSMGSLDGQLHRGGIGALKALFESKVTQQSSLGSAGRTLPSKVPAALPVVKAEGTKASAEGEMAQTPPPAVDAGDATSKKRKEEETPKVVYGINKRRVERRRTIGGVDLEKLTSFQDEEKGRGFSDIRENPLIQGLEKLPCSVKAMSARYLSKVTAVDQARNPLKPTQSQLEPSSVKKDKPGKMTEDSQKRTSDPLQRQGLSVHQSEATDTSSTHTLPSMAKSSNEKFTKLCQQRQKNELKRLLKYTHPELKTLEGVVDEELAEVMSSESGATAGETGYEGEVLSRRWIFESSAPRSSIHPATANTLVVGGTAGPAGAARTPVCFKPSHEASDEEERAKVTVGSARGKDVRQEEAVEHDEEVVRVDVLSARRMFESQPTEGCGVREREVAECRVMVAKDERGAVQKHKKAIETRSKHTVHREEMSNVWFKNMELTTSSQKQNSGVSAVGISPKLDVGENQPPQEGVLRVKQTIERPLITNSSDSDINKSRPILQNNPFISTNIAGEQFQNKASSPVETTLDHKTNEDMVMANVKNRAHLFESMPFDRINHHNKEEMQTMVEDMNESLTTLCRLEAITSHGYIIEVNETGIAKKAKYILSQGLPEILLEDVAEGGVQNFILQLLPRASLQPQVAYLKENEAGNVGVTMVDVPVHQHVFTMNQDKEFRTANAAQLIEDILNQDNSLRKGVIIQENAQGIAEVTVYSLYHYAEGDVKKYIPSQQVVAIDVHESLPSGDNTIGTCDKRTSDVRSTIHSLLATTQDYSSPVSIRPQDNIKGNVKLFRSFIEKGDLEKLKTFNADPSEEELPTVQNVAAGDSVNPAEQHDPDWAPVDVKKLKSMFSSNATHPSYVQPKQTKDGKVLPAGFAKARERDTHAERQDQEYGTHCVSWEQEMDQYPMYGSQDLIRSHETSSCTETRQNEDIVHLAELARVVDDDEEIEISNLQAAIDSLQQATNHAKTMCHISEEKKQLSAQSLLTHPDKSFSIKSHKDVVHQNTDHSNNTGCDSQTSPSQLTGLVPEHKSEKNQNIDVSYANVVFEKKQMVACHSEGVEDIEPVQKGHKVAAIHSLEYSTTEQPQEDNGDMPGGTVKAALDSLGRSSDFNASKGDFRAAMIYGNNSKSCTKNPKHDNVEFVSKLSDQTDGSLRESPATLSVTTSKVEQVSSDKLNTATAGFPSPSKPTNNVATSLLQASATQKDKRPSGPKPTIPPKPHYLQAISGQMKDSTKSENLNSTIENTSVKENKILLTAPQIVPPLSMKPMSYKDALCKGLSQKDSVVAQIVLDSEIFPTNVLASEVIQGREEIESNDQVEGSKVAFSENRSDNDNIAYKSQTSQPGIHEEEKYPQSCKEGNEKSTDEVNTGFDEVCQKFGSERDLETNRAPVKPKRGRIGCSEKNTEIQTSEENISGVHSHTDSQKVLRGPQRNDPNTCEGNSQKNNKCKEEVRTENQVVMRKKKVRSETQDELRQRLSVHMDGIIRENATTAMEIINHMKEQEELQNFLTTVEEIERDTNKVDVRSLKNVFEKASEWDVAPQVKKPKQVNAEHTAPLSLPAKNNTESMNSMANIFGDLEKASKEIIHLKEQTLARLMDIEGAIKKALYSVSTLKSDADISGLSVLFKESLGTERSSPNGSNIKTISIGSSRTKTPQAKEAPSSRSIRGKSEADQTPGEEIPAARNKSSPPSSPAFISIQSAARNNVESASSSEGTTTVTSSEQNPNQEDMFQSTKTLPCKRATPNKKKDSRNKGKKQAFHNPGPTHKSDVTIVKVLSGPGESSLVKENYKRTDALGNHVYSSKTSMVVKAQPETATSSGNVVVSRPATTQVTTYSEVRLPINKKPSPQSGV